MALWADGVDRSLAMLFSYNQEFRTDRSSTQRRDALRAKYCAALRRWKISGTRVVYIGNDTNEKRTYVSETSKLIRLFFAKWKVPAGAIVLTDNGHSFKEDGQSVFTSVGSSKHILYPAVVLQYLSPNDNRLHGAAKRKWRAMTTDYQDDEKSSLFLLHCIDLETTKNSRHYFNTNMLELSPAGATALVSGRKVGLTRYFKECEWEYKFMLRLPLLPDHSSLPEALQSTLDGREYTYPR